MTDCLPEWSEKIKNGRNKYIDCRNDHSHHKKVLRVSGKSQKKYHRRRSDDGMAVGWQSAAAETKQCQYRTTVDHQRERPGSESESESESEVIPVRLSRQCIVYFVWRCVVRFVYNHYYNFMLKNFIIRFHLNEWMNRREMNEFSAILLDYFFPLLYSLSASFFLFNFSHDWINWNWIKI